MTTSDAVRTALSWLATYGVHSTLFLGGAWLLCAFHPPRLNRNRERLWKLALVGGLASASLQVASGARPLLGHIDWPSTATARQTQPVPGVAPRQTAPEQLPAVAAPPTVPAPEDRSGPIELTVRGPRLRENESVATPFEEEARTPKSAPALASGPQEVEAPSARPSASEQSEPARWRAHSAPSLLARLAPLSRPERWPGLVLGIWIASGLLGLTGLLFSWASLRRRMLGRELLEHGPLVELLEQVRRRAGVARRVRLSVSPRIVAPFSTGVLRPEVCVPTAVVSSLSSAQQEALLAHELAHIVRRDPAWFGLGFLIEKLFFFQPLNRLARRRLAELAEVACDDWAVRWTGARMALASCLAEVAGWVVGERPRLAMPPGLAGNRSRLSRRVQRLLDDRRSPASDPPTRWWPPLAAGTLAFAALAVPGISAGNGASDATRSPAEPERRDPETPAAAPLAAPPAGASPAVEAPRPAVALTGERGVLESELALLEAELQALHAELEARALRTRFADALQRIDERMDELRAQQARARELLALLSTPNTPAPGPEPDADALPPPTTPGDSR